MSNTLADTLSDEFDESDFDDVLVQLTSIQEIQEDALVRLERLQKSLRAARTVSVDGVVREWDEVLDELHVAALRDIRETGQNPFGAAVQRVITKKIEATPPSSSQ